MAAADRHDFLLGGGEMGERLRAHDWRRSPLGPPGTWPQSLRTAVSIMLNSRHPMFLAWGPQLAFIYNDGYAPILGAKHPDALGRPFEEIWSEIWHDIRPLVDTALSGEATWSEDLHLVMERHGFPEDTWYTFSYSPIRDESGGVGGMFCACTETTEKVLLERRLKFQLGIAERLRPLNDPSEIKGAAASLLVEVLDIGRVGFAEVDPEGEWVTIEDDWRGTMAPLPGRYRLDAFGPEMAGALRAGRNVVVRDIGADAVTADATEAYKGIGVGAMIAVPLIKRGRLVAILSAHMPGRRAWTVEEVDMASELVDRTWSAVQRARAETQLRENEERLRMVQAAGGVGSLDFDMIAGRVYRSPEYLALQGLPAEAATWSDYDDAWLDRIHPDDRERAGTLLRAARDRPGPYDVEYRIIRPDTGETRWIHNRGRIYADAEGRPHRLLSVQTDVTNAKREDSRRQLLVNELNHRVKNTLATIQSVAAQTMRSAPSLEAARRVFEDRLLALSRTHDVLTRRTWEGATVGEIAAAAAEPYGPGRWRIEGPEVSLPPQIALSLSLALHELATNAAKYGALSGPEGEVEIDWASRDGELRLTWRERGGPLVSAPTRRGFGTRLIERGLARELGGDVKLEFAPDGVVCEVRAPLQGAG
ncbi:HWE histidine kinase domain-containing protein [Phenylobacterium sp.]|jgi:two-component sensor histidine kinase|uniref:PAS domain-containing sensor histidine kinase n=1 Tax=Phenylobacterium sp. TaxID=1871053 RepID=UPI0037848156